MKSVERKKARELRSLGWSVGSIAKQIKCSKSSISRWVRDISLTAAQIERLESNQERGRAMAAAHPNSPKAVWTKIREGIMEAAAQEIRGRPSSYIIKVVGASLYWAEGYKAGMNVVNFSNSDPSMIKLMMRFFREVCEVLPSKFRGAVHIHPHLDRERAVRFWARVSGIPLRQFHSIQVAVSRASKQKRDTLPVGTFRIVISDTRLHSRIKGWIRGIEQWVNRGGE